MADWQFHHAPLERYDFDGDLWVAAPASFTMAVNSKLRLRGAWYVYNGSGPMTSGEYQIQYDQNDDNWLDLPTLYAKNQTPQQYLDPPAEVPPDWTQFSDLIWDSVLGVGSFRLRMDVRSIPSQSGQSELFGMTVQELVTVVGAVGDLADFFDRSDFGVHALIDGTDLIPVIFEDPYQLALGVDGYRPEFIAESALLEQIGAAIGQSVVIGSSNYRIVQMDPETPDDALTSVRLEAV